MSSGARDGADRFSSVFGESRGSGGLAATAPRELSVVERALAVQESGKPTRLRGRLRSAYGALTWSIYGGTSECWASIEGKGLALAPARKGRFKLKARFTLSRTNGSLTGKLTGLLTWRDTAHQVRAPAEARQLLQAELERVVADWLTGLGDRDLIHEAKLAEARSEVVSGLRCLRDVNESFSALLQKALDELAAVEMSGEAS